MAEGAIDLIKKVLADEFGQVYQDINSKEYAVSGGDFDPEKVAETVAKNALIGVDSGLSTDEATYIADFYGTNALTIFKLVKSYPAYAQLSLAESAMLRYAMDAEMALTPSDYLMRRTNHILFQRDRLDEIKLPIVNAMANYYGWTDDEKTQYLAELNKVIHTSDLTDLKEG